MSEDTTTSENTEITSQIMGEDAKSLVKMDSKTKPTENKKPATSSDESEALGRNVIFNMNGSAIGNNNFACSAVFNNHFCRNAYNEPGGNNREGKRAGSDKGWTACKEERNEQ